MLTPQQVAAHKAFYVAALASKHIFPEAAAAEACLESTWATSKLYVQGLNIFGEKQDARHPRYDTLSMLTKEYMNNIWKTVNAQWVKYPTVADSFDDRMQTLFRLAPLKGYEHYKAALAATTPEQYLTEVSAKWSTDPERGAKCISIMHLHRADLNG